MSPDVPGFVVVAKALYNTGAQMVMKDLNETVFGWGGLVRMTANYADNNGHSTTIALRLFEANPNITCSPTDFDAPSN